jgi:hypothetical protein
MKKLVRTTCGVLALIVAGQLAAPEAAYACRLGVGDRVWFDVNGNGVQDAGETGINGVRVTISPGYYADLLDPNSFVDSMVTTTGPGLFGDGYYLFRPVDCDVQYTIAVDLSTVPDGLSPTLINAGGDPQVDSDDHSGTQVTLVNVGFDYKDLTIDFGFKMVVPPPSVGTGTPGYWKNHPEAWPVDVITIGGVQYTKAAAINLMNSGDGDKSLTMFRSLVSAKLNLLLGTDGSCIEDDVIAADNWMSLYGPAGKGVKANSAAWRQGEPLYNQLDAYNNGLLCAVSRDTLQ